MVVVAVVATVLTHRPAAAAAGVEVAAVDLNGDGAMDIVTSTGRGTFIFWGKPHAAKAAGTGRR